MLVDETEETTGHLFDNFTIYYENKTEIESEEGIESKETKREEIEKEENERDLFHRSCPILN